MGLNNVTLQGRVGADPEQRFFEKSGGSVTRLSLGIKEYISSSQTEKTIWVACKGFGRIADSLKNGVSKGREIVIQGKLDRDVWEKDGQKHSETYVVIQRWWFAGAAPRREDGRQDSGGYDGPEYDDEVGF